MVNCVFSDNGLQSIIGVSLFLFKESGMWNILKTKKFGKSESNRKKMSMNWRLTIRAINRKNPLEYTTLLQFGFFHLIV